MITPISHLVPGPPTIPLSDAARAACQDLYDELESAIEDTDDPGLRATLLASQTNVDNILTKDNMYRLHANTALFSALLEQINDTNDDLKALKQQIAAVASHIATAGAIVAAIDKVLTILPAAA